MFYNLKMMFFKTSFSSRELIPADIKSDASESICLHSLPLFLSQRVFVWDLDETIIIFHSLLTGTFASRYGKVRIHLSLFFFQHDFVCSWFVQGIVGAVYEAASLHKSSPFGSASVGESLRNFPLICEHWISFPFYCLPCLFSQHMKHWTTHLMR